MNRIATRSIVEVCRQREREGDCTTTLCPAPGILEATILELASRLERLDPSWHRHDGSLNAGGIGGPHVMSLLDESPKAARKRDG